MKVIVGLGNPGEKYKQTRHNIGFTVLDKLQAEISKSEFLISKQIQNSKFQFNKRFNAEVWQGGDILLAKPETFMNRSGEAVRKLVTSYQLLVNSLYVIHDDLDIPLGKYKIQLGKGPKVHNGLLSIYTAIKTKDFWHVRIGIDNRSGESGSGEDYVLGKFTREERQTIDKVVEEVAQWLSEAVK